MLETARTRSMWDGPPGKLVRTRSFTEAQLTGLIEASGMRVTSVSGTSLLALVLGWMRGKEMLGERDGVYIAEVHELLRSLASEGRMRRCHVVTARRDG
jgi:hypothetical protein